MSRVMWLSSSTKLSIWCLELMPCFDFISSLTLNSKNSWLSDFYAHQHFSHLSSVFSQLWNFYFIKPSFNWPSNKIEDTFIWNFEGISIVANKVKGVRCALCNDPYAAKMTRLHNDANMLALGGGMIGKNMACDILETFLNTEFSEGENHIRRIGLIE